jgi:hypothetical protein
MIKAVFDEMAAVRAEKEGAVSTIASARAPADGEDDEDDLDAVDADEDEEYGAFLEELYSPDFQTKMVTPCSP